METLNFNGSLSKWTFMQRSPGYYYDKHLHNVSFSDISVHVPFIFFFQIKKINVYSDDIILPP